MDNNIPESEMKRIERDAQKCFPITEDSTFSGLMQDGYVAGASTEYLHHLRSHTVGGGDGFWNDELVIKFVLQECNKYSTWDRAGLEKWLEKFKAQNLSSDSEWEFHCWKEFGGGERCQKLCDTCSGKAFEEKTEGEMVEEVPEEIMDFINEETDRRAFQVPYDGSNKFYDERLLKEVKEMGIAMYRHLRAGLSSAREKIKERAVAFVSWYVAKINHGKSSGTYSDEYDLFIKSNKQQQP